MTTETRRPVVGLIVPPAAGEVPPEPPVLYPGIDFIAEGLGLGHMSREGYDGVIGRVEEVTRALVSRGAEAVSLMGTSLSFYRGPAFNRSLVAAIGRAADGRPATTMSDSVMAALRAFGARRLAVATAYEKDVNDRLAAFLAAEGFETLALEAMSIRDVDEVLAVGGQEIEALGRRAVEAAPQADALFISCGGLKTLEPSVALERALGLPVVSSATAGAWGAARLTGGDGRAPGYGRLFEMG